MKVKDIKPMLQGKYRMLSSRTGKVLEKDDWNKGKHEECEVLDIWSDIVVNNKYCNTWHPYYQPEVVMYIREQPNE